MADPFPDAEDSSAQFTTQEVVSRPPLSLHCRQVTILRSRDRALYFVESPFDTFGPTPPAGLSYEEETVARSQQIYDDN